MPGHRPALTSGNGAATTALAASLRMELPMIPLFGKAKHTLAELQQQQADDKIEHAAVVARLKETESDGPNDPAYLALKTRRDKLAGLIEWRQTSAIPVAEEREKQERIARQSEEDATRAKAEEAERK